MTRLEQAFLDGFIKQALDAPNLNKFQASVPSMLNTASNKVNGAVSGVLGPTNYGKYQNINTNVGPNIAGSIHNKLQTTGQQEYLPQQNTDFLGKFQQDADKYVPHMPEAVSAYKHYKPWINDYNTVSQDMTDAKHAVLPITRSTDQAGTDVDHFIDEQGLRMSKQYQNLEAGLGKYKQFSDTPVWQRLLGLHNNRPMLNKDEFLTMNQALSTPGLANAGVRTLAQNPSYILRIAKDVANPVTTGSAIEYAGLGSKLVGYLANGSRIGALASRVAPNMIRGGGALAGAGIIGNTMGEVNDFSKNYDWDKGLAPQIKNYSDDINARNSANDFWNVPSFLHKFINNINHPVGSVMTAVKDQWWDNPRNAVTGIYGQISNAVKERQFEAAKYDRLHPGEMNQAHPNFRGQLME